MSSRLLATQWTASSKTFVVDGLLRLPAHAPIGERWRRPPALPCHRCSLTPCSPPAAASRVRWVCGLTAAAASRASGGRKAAPSVASTAQPTPATRATAAGSQRSRSKVLATCGTGGVHVHVRGQAVTRESSSGGWPHADKAGFRTAYCDEPGIASVHTSSSASSSASSRAHRQQSQ